MAGGVGYFVRKFDRSDAVLADNTADFIYGPRLLLSCDLTGSTHRHPHTLDIPGINERKRGEGAQV